jgi:uncharacterized protein (TIGR03067 family)
VRTHLLVGLLCGLVPTATDRPRDLPADRHRQKLQGLWRPVHQHPDAGLRWLRFRGDRLTGQSGPGGLPPAAAYRIDPTRRPLEIDFVAPGGGTSRGIYELHFEFGGAGMVLCYRGPGKERPTAFSARGDATLVVLKHVAEDPEP